MAHGGVFMLSYACREGVCALRLLHGLHALGDLVDDVVDVCAALDGADGVDEAHLHAAMQEFAAGTTACLPVCKHP